MWRRVAWIISLVLLVLSGGIGLRDGLTDWSGVTNGAQAIVTGGCWRTACSGSPPLLAAALAGGFATALIAYGVWWVTIRSAPAAPPAASISR